MKITNRAIHLGTCLLILAASFTFQLKAQDLEVGFQLNTLAFRSANNITEDVSSNPSRGMNLGGDFFLQQIKEKKYIRFTAGAAFGKQTSSSIVTNNLEEQEFQNQSSNLSLRIGFELGRVWRLGKKLRIQTGIRWALGRSMIFQSEQTNTSIDSNGDLNSSTFTTTKSPGALSASNLLVGRADYKISDRIHLGLGFQWGVGFSYSNVKRVESRTTTFGNGDDPIVYDGESTLRNANLFLTGLSRPLFNIGFMIGK